LLKYSTLKKIIYINFDGSVCVYILDEIYIVGKADNFDSLVEAVEAWRDEEI